MKKAFTFAELMISLVVISVITAILYPTIADLGVNENKALFKSAYRSMSLALAEVMNESQDGYLPSDLCTQMKAKLNVKSTYVCPLLETSNGMRWYIPNDLSNDYKKVTNNDEPVASIIIDVAPSNNTSEATNVNNITDTAGPDDYTGQAARSTFTNSGNGFASGAFGSGVDDAEKKQDTFVFFLNNRGQIINIDDDPNSIGYKHLAD